MNAMLPTPSRQRLSLRHLAVVFTATAALLAWVLADVARLPENVVVITVMTAAFIASWIVTNRHPAPRHQVTLIPVRVRATSR